MLMRFARTKCIAMMLGPAGTGFLAPLAIFFEAVRLWGDLGSRRGVIKQVAEEGFNGNPTSRYKEIVSASLSLGMISSVIVSSAIAFFSPQLSHFFYKDSSHTPYIIFVAFLLPFASLATVIASILKGNLDYVAYAKSTLMAYGIAFLTTPFIIYFYGLWGGMITLGLFFVSPLFVYLAFNLKKRFLYFSRRINFHVLKEQISYGTLQIYQDSWTHILRMATAVWIVNGLGLSAMGIFQAVMTFASVYLAVPIQAMSGYVFPLVAASKTDQEVDLAINESLRFLMFILVPVITGIMIFPEWMILLFFSEDFLAAIPILQIQLLSTLFVLMAFSYGVALTAKGKLKATLIVSTIYPVVLFSVAWLLFRRWQLMGLSSAFVLGNMVNFFLHYAYCRYYFRTTVHPKNQKLIAMTFLWIGIIYAGLYFFDHFLTRIALLSFGFIWFLGSSKDHERHFLIEKTRNFLKRGSLVKKPI